ncbi:tRNA pseudouridine(38/39) synthase [Paramyrothecium foliicola]|nr:tRNA pseudouridine(38/39) synthase [Paramyrothecium foliicola]
MATEAKYQSWTRNGLMQRVAELEAELRSHREAPVPHSRHGNVESPGDSAASATAAAAEGETAEKPPQKKKGKRKVDPSRYSTRYIALKLAYLGKRYGGFEFQAMGNLPSIEEELWNALTKACLIFPKDERVVDFECCEYSKCGRTDRGVSAFGQVIGLRVRSNRPLPKKRVRLDEEAVADDGAAEKSEDAPVDRMEVEEREDGEAEEAADFDPVRDEICYPAVLNRLLPPDIRILAWCPSPPPGFSARFSCGERRYRYFFTQPAFAPEPGLPNPSPGGGKVDKEGWLDIEAMRDAAKRFEGENDFRNFCKIDPAKQITNFKRTVYESDIEEVMDVSSDIPHLKGSSLTPTGFDDQGAIHPKIYSFNVKGSAFLWHQIRHMVGVLFLVGQGLEPPSIISELLDVEKNPGRPRYVMANETPLVLWDCIFPEDRDVRGADSLDWVYLGEHVPTGRFGPHSLMDGMWEMWRERKVDELLANQLFQYAARQGDADRMPALPSRGATSRKIFEGGHNGRLAGKYTPVMKLATIEPPEDQNDKYAKRKGYADSNDMRTKKGFRNAQNDEASADE